jgi:hypothetical protein
MNAALKARVRRRARNRCEYCRLAQNDSPLAPLHVEHIIPKVHGGRDDPTNLALACIDCNLHKGTNLAGVDPKTGSLTELFHPRRHRWEEHFSWQGIYIVGKTAIGRTTIRVLHMNSTDQLALRSS